MTTTTPDLKHYAGCDAPRGLDRTRYAEHGITTLRCVDCGAHLAYSDAGDIIPPPTEPGAYNTGNTPKPGIYDGITIERMESPR